MLAFDTETCGLVGPIVLMQYRKDITGDIVLYEPWKHKISETLDRIKFICEQDVLAFNIVFDWFHVNMFYNTLALAKKELGDIIPEEHIFDIANLQKHARENALCLKPKSACDLMLISRKGPFQSLMGRKPIRIRRVPTLLAFKLKAELEKVVDINDIYFSGKKDRWHILDTNEREFKDIELKFKPSGKLKRIHEHLFPDKKRLEFNEISVPKWEFPDEILYAPFYRGGKNEWPDKISYHIKHWSSVAEAREYAKLDISHLEDLYHHPVFNQPKFGDIDSELACLVGACRWKGYKVDLEKIKILREKAIKAQSDYPKAPRAVKEYISPHLTEVERSFIKKTDKETLKTIASWKDHPAAPYANNVIKARTAKKEVELYDKLLLAERFHSSFIIIGALSGRMSGTDDLNPQGIKRTKEVRECFPFADDDSTLLGGDFDQFEVAIADKVYDDPLLHEALLAGKKIHALMAVEMYPSYTYDEIMKTKGTENDLYGKGKNGVFTKIYGGDWGTLVRKYGVDEEVAKQADENWNKKYHVMAKKRNEISARFQAMSQPEGIGTRIFWKEPEQYIESFLGFRRYFTLEIEIMRTLFKLAQSPPPEWRKIPIKIVRRDREQGVGGAVQSALFGAMFAVQGKCIRAATNHIVQSPGAEKTKELQKRIWDLQPVGIHPFIVQPMNIHDEIMCPVRKGYEDQVISYVNEVVDEFKEIIPLIKFDMTRLNTWAEK